MASLATVGELEIYLGRTLDDPAQAQAQLDMASSAVRTYCGWELSRETTTMYVEGAKSALITLPTLWLIAVTAVRADGVAMDLVEYPINVSRKGQVWGYWVYGTQYEFDVEHGYDPVPDVVKLVTMDYTARRLSNPEGLTSATVGQVTKTWGSSRNTGTASESAMPTLHAGLLDRYRVF
jgi:hypothetical protein